MLTISEKDTPAVGPHALKRIVKRENVHYTRNSKVQVLLDILRLFGVKLFSIYIIKEKEVGLALYTKLHLLFSEEHTSTLIYFATRFPDQYRLLLWVQTGY